MLARAIRLSGAQRWFLICINEGKLPKRYQWNTSAKLRDLGLMNFDITKGKYVLTDLGRSIIGVRNGTSK